jgi:hypothetical protein
MAKNILQLKFASFVVLIIQTYIVSCYINISYF